MPTEGVLNGVEEAPSVASGDTSPSGRNLSYRKLYGSMSMATRIWPGGRTRARQAAM